MTRRRTLVETFLPVGMTALCIAACSSSSSTGTPSEPGAGGCSAAPCTAAGGDAGLGGAGTGGATNGGGTANGGASSTGGTSACVPIDVPAGTTDPNGVLALHRPAGDALGDPYGAEIAVANGYVYFILDLDLLRMPVDGGATELVHTFKDRNITFRLVGDRVVWYEQETSTQAWGIFETSATPGDAGAESIVANPIDEPDVIAWDDGATYFSNRPKSIVYRAPFDGSGVTELVTNAVPLGAAVSGSTYYWINFADDELKSIPVTGGTATSLVSLSFGGLMLADGATLFWNDSSDETLDRWASGQKNATIMAQFQPLEGIGSFAVQGGDVYFTREGFGCGDLTKVPGDGSSSVRVASGFDSASSVAVDSTYAYVIAWNGVFRVHR